MGGVLHVPKLPAVERIILLIIAARDADEDPRTLQAWGVCAARSPGTIREWCRAAGLAPKATLDFARLLRALTLAATTGIRVEDLIDACDCRTRTRLLRRAGFDHGDPPAIDAFLDRQRFITRSLVVGAVRAALLRTAEIPAEIPAELTRQPDAVARRVRPESPRCRLALSPRKSS